MSLPGLFLASTRVVEPLLRAHTPDALLAAVCRIAVDVAEIELAWIGMEDPDTHRIHPIAHHGPAAAFLDEIGTITDRTLAAVHTARIAPPAGRPFVSDDLQADTRLPWREAAAAHGLRAHAAIPLVYEDTPFATLHLHSALPGAFAGDGILPFHGLVDNACLALARLVPTLTPASSPSESYPEHTNGAGTALGELSTLLMNIIDSSSELVFVKDRTLRVVLCNQAFARLLGTTPEQAHGRTDADNGWMPEPSRDHTGTLLRDIEQEDRAVLAGEHVHTPRARVHVGGTERLFDMRKAPLCSATGDVIGIVCIAHDITERVRAEQALAASEANLRRAQELAQVGSWAVDVQSRRLTWSEESYRIFGLPPGKALRYEDFLAAVHPDDRAQFPAVGEDARMGDTSDLEFRIVVNGETKWVRTKAEIIADAAGRLVTGIGMIQDITTRKRAVEALTRTNRMLELLARTQSRFIAEMDPRATFEEMLTILLDLTKSDFGLIAKVLQASDGHPFLRTFAVTNLAWNEETQAFYEASVQAGMEFHNLDNLFGAVVKTGEVVVANHPSTDPRRGNTPPGHPPLHAFLGLPFKQGGELLGVVGIANRPGGYDEALIRYLDPFLATCASLVAAHDNDLRRRTAEDELRMLNAELEQRVAARTAELQQANQELEAFAYSVSHDLKAPLRAIEGFSAILLGEHAAALAPEGRRLLDRVRRAAQRMSQLIDDLLAYAKLDRHTLTTEPVDPRALVHELLAERGQEIAGRGVAVHVELPWTSIEADREGLSMALRNLLENALKFTRETPIPRIEVGGRQEAGARLLWVRDNGCGFDMGYHDRIFEIFHRLHRMDEYPGTGVGLALVRKAMQRMGGRVWAESRPGEGATFYLEIPQRA